MREKLEGMTWKQIVALHKKLVGGGIGDYARRNKAAEIDLIIKGFSPEQIGVEIGALGAVAPLRRAEPQQEQAQTQPDSADPVALAEEVHRIMRKPLVELQDELLRLVREANKPAVTVEKIVEVPVEKIVEKIVEVHSGKGPAAAQSKVRALFQPKIEVKTAKEVFGITLTNADGSPVKCEVYNDPLAPQVDKHYVWNEDHLHYALTAIWRKRNVWYSGPRGTGKTQFAEQLAARMKRSIYRVNFNGATDKTEVLGGDTLRAGDVQYREGVILQGIRRPGAIILLDEVGFARAEYLSALHAVLEANGCYTINETGETVAPAQGVVFIAADNSTGHGDQSGAYAGLKRINSAFLDRFAGTLMFEYMSPSVEAKILKNKTGLHLVAARHICDYMRTCRQKAKVGDIAEPPSLRQAMYFAEALMDGLSCQSAFEVTIWAKADPDSRETLKQVFNAEINQYGLLEVVAGRAKEIGAVTEENAEAV